MCGCKASFYYDITENGDRVRLFFIVGLSETDNEIILLQEHYICQSCIDSFFGKLQIGDPVKIKDKTYYKIDPEWVTWYKLCFELDFNIENDWLCYHWRDADCYLVATKQLFEELLNRINNQRIDNQQ